MSRYGWFLFAVCLAAGQTRAQESVTPGAGQGSAAGERFHIVSAAEMKPADAALLTERRPAIERAAKFYDYDMAVGEWAASQAVCPAAPAYLILYMREAETGRADSIFGVVVPRDGGQVRIIAVLRKGEMTRSNFGAYSQQVEFINRVVHPENVARFANMQGDFESLADCYAALSGSEFAPGASGVTSLITGLNLKGSAEMMSFDGIAADHSKRRWTIVFGTHGAVKSLTVTPAPSKYARRIKPAPPPKERSIPQGAAPAEHPIAPAK